VLLSKELIKAALMSWVASECCGADDRGSLEYPVLSHLVTASLPTISR